MLNRIRDIRKAKGLTLADLAAACVPPTTAQTIGRLETGTRQLSLVWMNRIAAALGVDPASLMRDQSGPAGTAQIVAELASSGASALTTPRAAVLPSELADTPARAISCGCASLPPRTPRARSTATALCRVRAGALPLAA